MQILVFFDKIKNSAIGAFRKIFNLYSDKISQKVEENF